MNSYKLPGAEGEGVSVVYDDNEIDGINNISSTIDRTFKEPDGWDGSIKL